MHETTFPSNLLQGNSQLRAAFEEIHQRLCEGDKFSVEEYVRRLPAHEEALRQMFKTMKLVGDLGNETSDQLESPASLTQPEKRLGEFTIVREVGRGGMGQVYDAYQGTLGRRVALKVLPLAGMANPRQIQRFQNEARAAATLHHTNIVPIHSVGSDRGVHYFAMQFIDGPTLADVIRHLQTEEQMASSSGAPTGAISSESALDCDSATSSASSSDTHREIQAGISTARGNSAREYLRTATRWIESVADGLAHAHENGVVHRDVKPGNLMVDRTGHVWITDFGLARLESEASMTATGDMLGTLRYMSPEQVSGDRVLVDHRTDIYSLGLTFYELLALRPAFPGDDRAAVLKTITHSAPPALRHIDKHIPAELETIVMKAIEKRPSDRYRSAGDMAEDLHRFLAGVPIRAKRTSLSVRVAKWSVRHRALVATVCAALVVTLMTSAIVFWNASRRTQLALNKLEQTNEKLRESEGRSLHALSIASDAIDNMYVEFANEWLAEQDQMTLKQRDFLDMAAILYEELGRNFGRNNDLYLRGVDALYKASQIHAELLDYEKRDALLVKAIERLDATPKHLTEERNFRLLNAVVRVSYRFRLVQSRAPETKLSEEKEAAAALNDLMTYSDQHPDDVEVLAELVRMASRHRLAKPSGTLLQAEKLVELSDTPAHQMLLSACIQFCARETDTPSEKLELAERSVQIMRNVCRLDPSSAYQINLTEALQLAGRVNNRHGNVDLAIQYSSESVEIWDELLQRFPTRSVYLKEASIAYGYLSSCYSEKYRNTNDREDLLQCKRVRAEAVRLIEEFDNTQEEIFEQAYGHAHSLFMYADVCTDLEQFDEASQRLELLESYYASLAPATIRGMGCLMPQMVERGIKRLAFDNADFTPQARRLLMWRALNIWNCFDYSNISEDKSLYAFRLNHEFCFARLHPDRATAANALKDLQTYYASWLEKDAMYDSIAAFLPWNDAFEGAIYRDIVSWGQSLACLNRGMEHVCDRELALELTERAIEENPEDGNVICKKAWALYRLHRFDEALESFQRSPLSMDQRVGPRGRVANQLEVARLPFIVRSGRALTLHELGRDEEALRQYRLACDAWPEEPFYEWPMVGLVRKLHAEFGHPERAEELLRDHWWGSSESEFYRSHSNEAELQNVAVMTGNQ